MRVVAIYFFVALAIAYCGSKFILQQSNPIKKASSQFISIVKMA